MSSIQQHPQQGCKDFRIYGNKFCNLLHFTKRQFYKRSIQTITESKDNIKALYKITDSLIGKDQKLVLPSCASDIKLCEDFSNYFTDKVQQMHTQMDNSRLRSSALVPTPCTSAYLSSFPIVTNHDVGVLIKNMKPKACVLDPIPAYMFKEYVLQIAPPIRAIINASLFTGTVPNKLKESVITPRYKRKQLPKDELSIVSKMHIIDNIVCSDHMPLCIEIECDIVPICNSTFIKEPRDVCKWNLAGDKEKLSYKTCTNELFSDIIIPVDALLCNNAHCIEHVTDIDNFYTCIINGIQSAEKKCIPFESIGKNYHTVPGWNEYVKDNHAVARDAFWLWNLYGRPNQGQLYHSMRSSRAHFKYALKFAKRIEDTAKADALAKDLGGQKHDDFWKSVSKINQNSQLHATTIDGINGEANIANYWRNHFHGILNSNVCDQALKNSILGTLDDIQHDARMTVCYTDVQTLIHKLEFGKSAGPDGICAEALKCAHDQLSVLLSLCFTLFLSHGYLPPKLIETTIVPIIKNKCGNISSSSNYRPIALATIISKLLESILLLKCEEYLCTSANQFGFKTAHGTELCIYTLREYIELYRKRSTTVFVTFLDASKAFDRLDHWLLFEKLIYRKVPLFIVRLLIVWYSLQRMHIRWGNTFSTSFCVSNGVKQGGIISPVLFNVYMDDLSCELNRSNIGGRIGGEIVNHLSYADDLCLICLSSAGMQKLLNVCSKYATKHSLSYNASKSYSLCFKATTIKFKRPTLHIGQINIPNVTDCRYLGITISVKNCDLDLKRQMRKCYANANMLLRKFVKCSPDVKCYLFKTYCCNLYCAPFWYDSTKAAMKNLKVAYNNSLRRLLGLPSHNSASGMFVNLNIPSFGELLRKYVYSFRNRLESSENIIIRGIYLSQFLLQSGIWVWWRDILSP